MTRGDGRAASGENRPGRPALIQLFRIFLVLGLTSFGGPIAHLGYFRRAFVTERAWLTESDLAGLIALCQMLPGPTSSEVGIAIGARARGLAGALLAWIGFTLPSAVLMIGAGLAYRAHGALLPPLVVHALDLVAVVVVAQALWSMARSLTPDWPRRAWALAVAAVLCVWPGGFTQLALLAATVVLGVCLEPRNPPDGPVPVRPPEPDPSAPAPRRGLGVAAAFLAVLLLAVLPLVAYATSTLWLERFSAYYRAGLLVFGGGHVVLPLLHGAVVDRGWVDDQAFFAGYGAAQALPGPLFTFAAFLGSVDHAGAGGVAGGTVALLGIFLPAFLLVAAALPFWHVLQAHPRLRTALTGINAAVVGMLAAALINPLALSTLTHGWDLIAVALGLWALMIGRWPPLALVALALAAAGGAVALGLPR